MQFDLEGFLCFSPGRNIDSGNQGDFFVYLIFNNLFIILYLYEKKSFQVRLFRTRGINKLRAHKKQKIFLSSICQLSIYMYG